MSKDSQNKETPLWNFEWEWDFESSVPSSALSDDDVIFVSETLPKKTKKRKRSSSDEFDQSLIEPISDSERLRKDLRNK